MNRNILRLQNDIRLARKLGIYAIMQRQNKRFKEMVNFARYHSPYYKELYQGLPETINDSQSLPITNKKSLLSRFDDWCTDRNVTLENANAFVNDPRLVGELFLGKYLIGTSSGSTGTRGIFLIDNQYDSVNRALTFGAMFGWLNAKDIFRIVLGGGRIAILAASGGHFLSCAGFSHMHKTSCLAKSKMRLFSVYTPTLELVAQLNAFQPAVVFGYGSTVALLAQEQAEKRLDINPTLLIPSGESLRDQENKLIAKQFNKSKIRDLYGASECSFMASSCEHGWLHVNSDWVIFEPVDANYKPIKPGELSHTVLITNLANRVQPILRYDLGDRILVRPDPCPCGSPLPAIQIKGRSGDMLLFQSAKGEEIPIAPLTLTTLVDRIPGIKQFQIVQASKTILKVRLNFQESTESEHVWETVLKQIKHFLAERQLDNILVEKTIELPQQTPSGKIRTIVPLGEK